MQFLKVTMPAARLLQPVKQQSRAEGLPAPRQKEADTTFPSPPAEQNDGQDPFRNPHAAAHSCGGPAGKAVQLTMLQAAEGLSFMLCVVIRGCSVARCPSAKLRMAACRCKPQLAT